MASGIDYTDDEWRASAGHFPLRGRSPADLILLHRHWMWANQQREAFDQQLGASSAEARESVLIMMATREWGFMFVWYGLLWSLVEACMEARERRELDIRGPFLEDIERIAALLRRCRNAVLHVPRSGEPLDSRILNLLRDADSATTIRRVHRGFGRLFLEEFDRDRPINA